MADGGLFKGKTGTKDLTSFEKAYRILLPEMRRFLNEKARDFEKDIDPVWVQPKNAKPHTDGSPSQSTGLSFGSFDISQRASPEEVTFNVDNDIDYASYVRFSGRPEGESARDVEKLFSETVFEIQSELTKLIERAFERA